MPNDTTTLNGALRQLGETMAANLTTQGVPSTYDEGLTTLAGKILDIQGGGGTRTLTLTADKSILSYYDGDEAILSATLLEDGVAVSGATVEFFNGSTSMGTAQTDSNGVATKTYTSTGAGDVEFTAEADNGTLLSETYTLEDCHYYNDNTYSTSSTTLNIPLPNGAFQLEYNSKQGTNSSSMPYLDIGNASNDRMLVGQYARAGGNGLVVYKSSNTTYSYPTNIQLNTENNIKFIYTGSEYQYSLNNGSVMTVSDQNITLAKLIHIESGGNSNNWLKNIKIKPL